MGYDVGLLILTPNGWMWLSDLGTCGFKHLEHLFGSQIPRMSQNFYPQWDLEKILQVSIHLELLKVLSYSEFYEKYYGISIEEHKLKRQTEHESSVQQLKSKMTEAEFEQCMLSLKDMHNGAEEYQEPDPNDLVLMVITEEYWDCHPPLSEMITIQSTP